MTKEEIITLLEQKKNEAVNDADIAIKRHDHNTERISNYYFGVEHGLVVALEIIGMLDKKNNRTSIKSNDESLKTEYEFARDIVKRVSAQLNELGIKNYILVPKETMTEIEQQTMESIISNLPRIANSLEVIAASKDKSAENVLELDDKDLEYLYLSVCCFLGRAGALNPDIMYGDLRKNFVEYYKTPKIF